MYTVRTIASTKVQAPVSFDLRLATLLTLAGGTAGCREILLK